MRYLYNLPTLALSTVFLSALAAPAGSFKPRFEWDKIKYVYAFGDSYTFVGGTEGYPRWR